MRVRTRSRRVTKALAAVMRRLPADDRRRISAFLTDVVATKTWWTNPFGDNNEYQSAGEVVPIICLTTGERVGARVRFQLPVCRLYSDRALRGIVAHELAHVLRASRLASQIGGDWYETMTERYGVEERAADRIATAWGFGKDIRQGRDHERVIVQLQAALAGRLA